MSNRLSPEARARLEEARAIAQGRPSPRTAPPPRSRPVRGAARGAPPAQPDAAAAATPAERGSGGRALAIVGGLGLLAVVAAGALLLGRSRDDLVGTTAQIQSGLLEGRLDDSARKKAIAEVIRNADRMTKEELETARRSLEQEWQRLRDKAIDTFFAAPEGDRPRLADEGIDLTLAYRKLRFGLSPQARDEGGRRQRPPKDQDQRKLFDRYAEALSAQAKLRGISLPEWQ